MSHSFTENARCAAHAPSARSRRRRAARPALEALESRELLSASLYPALSPLATQLIAAITTTNSSEPIHRSAEPGWPIGGGITPSTAQSTSLINLDDFRNDPRFSAIDGAGYAVVIMDTGIDLDHPYFGPDANMNGVSDRIVYSYDFADGDANASDVDGHGSNVSSIVGSSNATHRGMAPGVNIIHLKVFRDDGSGSFGYLEAGLQWVVANAGAYNIVSVNMSLGDSANYNTSRTLYGVSDELAALAAMDIIPVASNGNDFYGFSSALGVAYPAADPNTIAVGAVYDANIGGFMYQSGAQAFSSAADRITPFSQRHATLTDIFAPGAGITGANHAGATVTQHGTSQASPHIAGIAALAQQLAMNRLGRFLTIAEFRSLMESTGVNVVDGDDENDNVTNSGLTFKRIDVFALGEAISDMAPGPEILVTLGATTIVDGVSVIDFGPATPSATVQRVFTVRNTGDEDLTLTEPISLPAGFTLNASFGETTLSPNETTTFTVSLDTSMTGSFSGSLSFANDDENEDPFNFTITGFVGDTLILDNSDPVYFYRTMNNGGLVEGGGGHDDDYSYAPKKNTGTPTRYMVWVFSGLTPGRYLISATWVEHANRATNAKFQAWETDGTLLATAQVNQEIAPGDRSDDGVDWDDLAYIDVTGATVNITLGNNANQFVIGDAIRLQQADGPEIEVSQGATAIVDGVTMFSFGATVVGNPVDRVFTVRNTGNQTLNLSALSAPAGFMIVAGFGDASLAPDEQTTFTIRMEAGGVATPSGSLSFTTDDSDENPFNFTISGEVIAAPATEVIDDGEAGYGDNIVSGGSIAAGRDGDSRWIAKKVSGATRFTWWIFSDLPSGQYRISVTWPNYGHLATNAPFRIVGSDGALLATVVRNQRLAPNDRTDLGSMWEDLGLFNFSGGGDLTITLGNNANGPVIGDAVRVERVGSISSAGEGPILPPPPPPSSPTQPAIARPALAVAAGGDFEASEDPPPALPPVSVPLRGEERLASISLDAAALRLRESTMVVSEVGSVAGVNTPKNRPGIDESPLVEPAIGLTSI